MSPNRIEMMTDSKKTPGIISPFLRFLQILKKDRFLLLIMLPGLIYFVLFKYVPMHGILIAFEKYNITKGVFGSQWVGLKHFVEFFTGYDAWTVIKNTIVLNVLNMVISFPVPIVFAILLNELRQQRFKRVVQTVSYLPHFISNVIIVGMLINFLSPTTGIVNKILGDLFGMKPIAFVMEPGWFRAIYIFKNNYKEFGWGAIIYLAALTSIDVELYEAAYMDGANRFKRIWHITIPGVARVATIMLILSLGNILESGTETILLMYTPSTYEVSDVISTYVYRKGLADFSFDSATAVGLFQSVIGLVFVVGANKISKKVSETSLW